jgi:TolA-binding protein
MVMRHARRWPLGVAMATALAVGIAWVPGGAGAAVTEGERRWIVGARAFEDGLYDIAFLELGRFVELAPADPRRGDATFLRGKSAYALGRYAEALSEFQTAETYPLQVTTLGEPMFWQAETLFRLKRLDEARAKYTLFLRGYPQSIYAPDALYAEGLAELDLGRSDEAMASFTRLLRDYPKSERAAPATYSLARELVRLKRWTDALPLLASFPSRYPGSSYTGEVRYLLGLAQLETGRTVDGLRTLEQYIVSDPQSDVVPSARLLVAETQVKAGRPQAALDQYQTLVRTAPPGHPLVPQALYQIGDLSVRVGRPADAEGAWTRIRRDFPQDPYAGPAGVQLATLYVKRRQLDAAMQVAHAVADERGGERLTALLLFGESALQARRTEEAAQAYRAVVAEAPADSPDRFRGLAGVALAAEVQKDVPAAKEAYQQIVTGAGDPELVRWAKGRLLALAASGATPPRDVAPGRQTTPPRDESPARQVPKPRSKPTPPVQSGSGS